MSKTKSKGTSNDKIEPYDVSGAVEQIFPNLIHAIHEGHHGRETYCFSVQCLDDGSYRGFIKSRLDVGGDTERGRITFFSGDSLPELLSSFENKVLDPDLIWREDKWYKPSDSVPY